MFANFTDREVLKVRELTNNPFDNYLKVTLCKYNNQYVTWIFNTTLDGGKGGFVEGKYFGNDLDSAIESFNTRS